MDGHQLLAGKTVLVTAAAGTGIGFATAKRCVEEGARVVISDAHERRLAEAASSLGDAVAASVVCDVTDEAQVQSLFETGESAAGGIDVVVNNAGLGGTADIVDMRSSIEADSIDRSDSPVPRLSNRTHREKVAIRLNRWRWAGLSQSRSRCDTNPGVSTRSIGPSPIDWNAIETSPLVAYRVRGRSLSVTSRRLTAGRCGFCGTALMR